MPVKERDWCTTTARDLPAGADFGLQRGRWLRGDAAAGGAPDRAAVEDQVLVNAWRYALAGNPGYTWDRANPYVATAGSPRLGSTTS